MRSQRKPGGIMGGELERASLSGKSRLPLLSPFKKEVLMGASNNITLFLALALLSLPIDGRAQQLFATGFRGPENLAFDGKGDLYVSDTESLWRVNPEGDKKELYRRDPDTDGVSLGGVSLGPEGKIYFSTGNQLKIFNPQDESVAVFVRGFHFANGNCFNDAGDFFIADSNARQLFVVPAGSAEPRLIKDKMGKAPGLGVNGLVWDRSSQTLYYTQNLPAKVGGIKLGPDFTVLEDHTLITFPTGGLDDLALDQDGNLYVCLWLNGKVVRVSPHGDKETLLEGLDGPSALEFAPGSGALFILIKGGTMAFQGTDIITTTMNARAYRLPFLP
jgi:sugar lactone lactonase YvrE